jgi:protein-tyrosine phosphatase
MTKPSVVLFLCSGNYYRSRFAEHLFNARAAAGSVAWCADSAGLEPNCLERNPGPISAFALAGLAARGIPLSPPHRLPRDVSEDDLASACCVIAMKDAEHRPLLRARFAEFERKVEFWNIDDVGDASPEHALPLLERQVIDLLARLDP